MTLADKLQQSSAGSRELDCLIHAFVNPNVKIMTDGGGYRGERGVEYTFAKDLIVDWRGDWTGFGLQINAPPYSTSLDAAMTLVPEGRYWTLKPSMFDESWAAALYLDGSRDWFDENTLSEAATPALALSAAAIQAQES